MQAVEIICTFEPGWSAYFSIAEPSVYGVANLSIHAKLKDDIYVNTHPPDNLPRRTGEKEREKREKNAVADAQMYGPDNPCQTKPTKKGTVDIYRNENGEQKGQSC